MAGACRIWATTVWQAPFVHRMWMSDAEQSLLGRIRRPVDRDRLLLCTGMVRSAVLELTGLAPQAVPLEQPVRGGGPRRRCDAVLDRHVAPAEATVFPETRRSTSCGPGANTIRDPRRTTAADRTEAIASEIERTHTSSGTWCHRGTLLCTAGCRRPPHHGVLTPGGRRLLQTVPCPGPPTRRAGTALQP